MDNPRRRSRKHVYSDLVRLLLLVITMGFGLPGCVTSFPGSDHKAVDPKVYEQKNLELAYGFLQQGHPSRAINRLQAILKVKPRSAQAHGMLGVVYQSQGEYGVAQENFIRALKYDPKASDIRNNYGVLLYETGQYSLAWKQLKMVTEDIYYDERSRAFENLGFVALKTGYRDKAMELFQRALRLEPSLVKASLELAELFHEGGNFVESERYFLNHERLSGKERLSPRALWLGIRLARIFQKAGKLEQYVDQLTRYYPGSGEYRKYQASLGT